MEDKVKEVYSLEVFLGMLESNSEEVLFTDVCSSHILLLVGLLEAGVLSYLVEGYLFDSKVSLSGRYKGVEFVFNMDVGLYELLLLCVPKLKVVLIQGAYTGQVILF
jgi:hypothetical protein